MAKKARSFIVHRAPFGKVRAHPIAFKGADGKYHGRSHNDEKNETFEGIVRAEYVQQVGYADPFKGAVEALITACYEIPGSWSKKKQREAAEQTIKPTKKPDADNIAKAICDALNGLAYKDDAQIVNLHVCKVYTNELPNVKVTLIGEV